MNEDRRWLNGCDCDDCFQGDDRWCCRPCHDLARGV